MPPMIDMYGQKYVAPNMPVNELPQGYTYLGELSKEQANGTGLEGCKMYAVTELDSIPDFYLYRNTMQNMILIIDVFLISVKWLDANLVKLGISFFLFVLY